jgi:hypothetical protein
METIVAVVAVLAGFGLGYAFRGWYARRDPRPPGAERNKHGSETGRANPH